MTEPTTQQDVELGYRNTLFDWKGTQVPKPVYDALKMPLRGQAFGSKLGFLLEQFHDEAILESTLHPNTTWTEELNVVVLADCMLYS